MIKTNCWGCGCKLNSEDFYRDEDIIFRDGHYWCDECDDAEFDAPEDTYSLMDNPAYFELTEAAGGY